MTPLRSSSVILFFIHQRETWHEDWCSCYYCLWEYNVIVIVIVIIYQDSFYIVVLGNIQLTLIQINLLEWI